jgi:AAA+ superfamily predicted ATPase
MTSPNPTPTSGEKAAADVTAALRSRSPLLWIVSREEARVERQLVAAAAGARLGIAHWDCSAGLTGPDGSPIRDLVVNGSPINGSRVTDPSAAIAAIAADTSRRLWVLRDISPWLRDPTVVRALRSLARALPSAPAASARAVVCLGPSGEVPPELAGTATVIDWPAPDRAEIAALLDAAIAALPDDLRATAAPNGTRDAAIDAAVGLSEEEAQSCYARSLVQCRAIDPARVASEKKRVISRERVLEWYDPLPGGLDSVGGLEALKAWLTTRRAAFTSRARAYGLPAPKGALLVGVPGCGKSLTAKAIATAWGMPLLRLDVGALRSKFVGDSEANIRRALRVAETVAPCVLWLDELEKALAGSTGPQGDGGVGADALGAILSWMQERAGSVFVVATANDVSALPPELLRKGRFDEVWFVDLPTRPERAAILAATLRQYGRPTDLVSDEVVSATADFTGAEIAALVPDALFAAFAEEERPITAEDLAEAARRTNPLARTAAEKITAIRQWAAGRARSASLPEEAAEAASPALARALDL